MYRPGVSVPVFATQCFSYAYRLRNTSAEKPLFCQKRYVAAMLHSTHRKQMSSSGGMQCDVRLAFVVPTSSDHSEYHLVPTFDAHVRITIGGTRHFLENRAYGYHEPGILRRPEYRFYGEKTYIESHTTYCAPTQPNRDSS